MEQYAFNDMLGKGFDSTPQENLMWMLYEMGCKGSGKNGSSWDYEWVPEVYNKHGHASGPYKGFNDWPWPCATASSSGQKNMIRGLLVYGHWLRKRRFDTEAHAIDCILAHLVRSSQRRVLTASYLDHVRERAGLGLSISSVEDALADFSERLGLDPLTRRAMGRVMERVALDDFERDQEQDLQDAKQNPKLVELGLGIDPEKPGYNRKKRKLRRKFEEERDSNSMTNSQISEKDDFDLLGNAPFNATNEQVG